MVRPVSVHCPGRTPGGRAAPQDPPRLSALREHGPVVLGPRDRRRARPALHARARRGPGTPGPRLCADVSLAPRGRASIHSPRADSPPRRGGSFRLVSSLAHRGLCGRRGPVSKNAPSSCCWSAATEGTRGMAVFSFSSPPTPFPSQFL